MGHPHPCQFGNVDCVEGHICAQCAANQRLQVKQMKELIYGKPAPKWPPEHVTMVSDVDRILDAFAQRLERQRATGDIKGAAATQSAIALINSAVRT